ncbi:hypothetical protein ACQ4LE_004560 [Meloidogyne hapla]
MPSLKFIFLLFYLLILKSSGFLILVKIDWTGKEECRKGQNNRFELELKKLDRNENKIEKQTKWTNNYDLVLFHEGYEENLLNKKWKGQNNNVYQLLVSVNVPGIEDEKRKIINENNKIQFHRTDYFIIILKIDGLKFVEKIGISIPNWSEYALLILRPIKIIKIILKQKRMENIKMFVGCGNDEENKYLFELDQKTEEGYYSKNNFGIKIFNCFTAINEGEMENVYIVDLKTGKCQLKINEKKLISQENIKENMLTEKQLGIYQNLINIQEEVFKPKPVESSQQTPSSSSQHSSHSSQQAGHTQQTPQYSSQQTTSTSSQHSTKETGQQSSQSPQHSSQHTTHQSSQTGQQTTQQSPKQSSQHSPKTNIQTLQKVQQHPKQPQQIIRQINPSKTLTPQQNFPKQFPPHISKLIKEVADYYKKLSSTNPPVTLQEENLKTLNKIEHSSSPSTSALTQNPDPFKNLPMQTKLKIVQNYRKNFEENTIQKPQNNPQINLPILNELTMRIRNESNFKRKGSAGKIKLSSGIQLTEEKFEKNMKVKKPKEEIDIKQKGKEKLEEEVELMEDEEINLDQEELEEGILHEEEVKGVEVDEEERKKEEKGKNKVEEDEEDEDEWKEDDEEKEEEKEEGKEEGEEEEEKDEEKKEEIIKEKKRGRNEKDEGEGSSRKKMKNIEDENCDEFATEQCKNPDNSILWEYLLEEYSEIEENLNLRSEMKDGKIYLPKGKSRFFEENNSGP